jgi:hypothetical protein
MIDCLLPTRPQLAREAAAVLRHRNEAEAAVVHDPAALRSPKAAQNPEASQSLAAHRRPQPRIRMTKKKPDKLALGSFACKLLISWDYT